MDLRFNLKTLDRVIKSSIVTSSIIGHVLVMFGHPLPFEDSINAAEYADGAAEDGDGSENEGAPSESPIFRRYMAQELDKLVDKGLRCTWKETPSGVLFAYHPTYPDLIFDLTRQANRTATVRFRKEYDRRR